MSLSRKNLGLALSFAGTLLLWSEFRNSELFTGYKTIPVPETGEIISVPEKRGMNPFFTLSAIAAIYGGLKNLDDGSEVLGNVSEGEPATLTSQKPMPPMALVRQQRGNTAKPKAVSLVEQITNYTKSILVAAVTGCGKTTLIRAAVMNILQWTKGTASFAIVDPKNSKYGIEDFCEPVHEGYPFKLNTNSTEECESILEFLQWVLDDLLVERQKNRDEVQYAPFYIIFDEWVALQTKISSRLGASELKRLNNLVQELIVMGREDGVRVWLIGQSHQCGEIGLSKSIRSNLGLIALAAPDNTKTVDAMQSDSHLFPKEEDRQAIAANAKKLAGNFFYLSTLGLNPELGISPKPQTINTLTLDTSDIWEIEDERITEAA